MFALGPITLAAATLLASTGPTIADESTPIQISQCSVEDTIIPVSNGDVLGEQVAGLMIHIRFTNVSPTPIASVTFNVDVGNTEFTIVDAGKFSQGVSIDRHYARANLLSGDATCHAVAAQFKDGSSATMD